MIAMKKIVRFFDKFEDHVRARLSKYPILYTFIGGIAIVLFWKGVWDTADMIPWLHGPMSILISVTILLATGLFVSFFVGDVIILSGIKNEKKLIEKTESEIATEGVTLDQIKKNLEEVKHMLQDRQSH